MSLHGFGWNAGWLLIRVLLSEFVDNFTVRSLSSGQKLQKKAIAIQHKQLLSQGYFFLGVIMEIMAVWVVIITNVPSVSVVLDNLICNCRFMASFY